MTLDTIAWSPGLSSSKKVACRAERLTTKGTLRGLIHRGGLRADVLTGLEIATDDLIETID